MAGDYDYDLLSCNSIKVFEDIKIERSPYIDISSRSTTVYSVTTSTLPNNDTLYIYRTSDGLTTRTSPDSHKNLNFNPSNKNKTKYRFEQIVLELEAQE
jgi:hypothetical protein